MNPFRSHARVLLMTTNVEITRAENENNTNALRRFKKRVQSAGILPKIRKIRYRTRHVSKLTKKKSAIKRIRKYAAREKLYKLGKVSSLSGKIEK